MLNTRSKTPGLGHFFRGGAAAMFLTMTAAGCGGGAATFGQAGSNTLPPLSGSGPVSAGSSDTNRVIPSAAARSLPAAATVSAAATGSGSLLYAADAANNAIYVYSNVPNAKPTRVITTDINNSLNVFDTKNGNNGLPAITGAGIDEPTALVAH